MFPRSKGIDRKIGDIATIIDDQQLGVSTGPVPLDDGQQSDKSLRDEAVTAIQELKDISQALIAGVSLEDQVQIARKLMLIRQTTKLIARAYFEPASAKRR